MKSSVIAALTFSFLHLVWFAPVRGQDVPEIAPLTTVEACETLEEIITTIEQRHLQPPSRQQMVAAALTGMTRADQRGALFDRIAAIDDPQQLFEALRREINTLHPEGELELSALLPTISYLGDILPGGLRWADVRTATVERQLAANRYVGIGVIVSENEQKKRITFVKVMEGGSAEEVGIRDNDTVISIAGVDTKGKTLNELIEVLRGPQGSVVEIEVQASDSEDIRKYSVPRRVVPVRTINLHKPANRPDVAVLTVSQLTASGPHELRQIESRLSSEVKNIIIDLRATADTDLHNAHIFADALTEEAALGAVKSRTGVLQIRTEPGRVFRNRRVILLISQRTSPYAAWASQGMLASGIEVCMDTLSLMEGGRNLVPVRPPVAPNVAFIAPLLPALETIELSNNHGSIVLATGRLLGPDQTELTPNNLQGRMIERREFSAGRLRAELAVQFEEVQTDEQLIQQILNE